MSVMIVIELLSNDEQPIRFAAMLCWRTEIDHELRNPLSYSCDDFFFQPEYSHIIRANSVRLSGYLHGRLKNPSWSIMLRASLRICRLFELQD